MKNLRLVFENAGGEKRDITLPMEKWIRDWWYECDFVPTNGMVPEIAELDGEDILKDFPDNYNTFEDIAYRFRWDEVYDDFYGDVETGVVKSTGEAFEQWIRDNINVGDTVKVIATTNDASYCDGRKKEYIPIGTICTVIETDINEDGTRYCAVDSGNGYAWWYKADELEKGHMEWIKDE